jgi:hypothetical protein
MPAALKLVLTPDQVRDLETLRDTDPLPYRRERAAALLKIADDHSGRAVALTGLLKVRQPDTIYAWVKLYRTEGVAGLSIHPGRGRPPAFSPSAPYGGERPRGVAAPRAARAAGTRRAR